MRVFKPIALFGATASAVSPLAVRNAGPQDGAPSIESVVLVTSTFTVTKCATDAVNCPSTAIILSTTTTVVSTTTTICSTTSVPAVAPSTPVGITSATAIVSSLPLGPGPVVPSTTTSRIPSTLALPTMPDAPSVTSKSADASDRISVSVIPGSTIESSISIVPTTPSVSEGSSYNAPVESTTAPSAINPSGPSSSSGRSSITDAISSSGVSSGYASSRPSGTSSGPINTNTDATATSFPVGSSTAIPSGSQPPAIPSYSTGYGASSRVSATASTSVSAVPSSNTSTVSSPLPYPSSIPGSQPSVSPGSSVPVGSSIAPSSSSVDTTVLVTTRTTQTHTSYITVPPSSGPNTNTETDATWSLRPSSMTGVPSGSGFPYPSYSSNGTVISPKPTYSEIPVNAGNVIGASEHSYAALVVALAFMFFA